MLNVNLIRCLPLLASAAFLAPSAFAVIPEAEQRELQKEGLVLIRQLEEVGRDVRYNAGRINSFSSNIQISNWTHNHHLDQIRTLVNEGLRPAIVRLVELQPRLPEWKQQSIDRMLEAAKALAKDTDSAIIAKRETGWVPPAMNAEYKDLMARVYEHAETLVKTSDAAGTYAAARLKAFDTGLKVD